MAVNERRAGVASLTLDGVAYDVVGSLRYSPTRVTRETLIGQSGIQGFKEMPRAGYIAASIRDSAVLNVGSFNAMTNVTAVAILASGKTVSGSGMWCVDAQEVDTVEAAFEVRFEGPSVEEN